MTLLCLALSRTTMIVSPAAFGWLGFCAVFGVMTGLWCLGAYWLVSRGPLGRRLRDIAARTPWMLIAIGIVIISHTGSFAWLFLGVGRG
jgi:hypothetical protein